MVLYFNVMYKKKRERGRERITRRRRIITDKTYVCEKKNTRHNMRDTHNLFALVCVVCMCVCACACASNQCARNLTDVVCLLIHSSHVKCEWRTRREKKNVHLSRRHYTYTIGNPMVTRAYNALVWLNRTVEMRHTHGCHRFKKEKLEIHLLETPATFVPNPLGPR